MASGIGAHAGVHQLLQGFILEAHGLRPQRGRIDFIIIIIGSVWGEVELFGGGGEASPAPPSLDETLAT